MILADLSFARTDIILSWLPTTCETSWKLTHCREGNDNTFTIGRLELVISRYMAAGISVTWNNNGDANDTERPAKPRPGD